MTATASVDRASAALLVERLTKVYADGTRALDELELRIPSGCFFGVLGPNGAGKTTLIGAIAGLVRAPAGRAFVFGHDAVTDLQSRLLVVSRRRKCTSIASSPPARYSRTTGATSGCRSSRPSSGPTSCWRCSISRRRRARNRTGSRAGCAGRACSQCECERDQGDEDEVAALLS
jgi:energy-coupling factor transporter ATP-binding protein EcfA2